MAWAVTKDAPESTSADGLMPQKPSLGAPHILHISTEEVVSPGGSYVKKQQFSILKREVFRFVMPRNIIGHIQHLVPLNVHRLKAPPRRTFAFKATSYNCLYLS